MSPSERRWVEAIDWLLNSTHTANPEIQDAFWGIVDGRYTRDQVEGAPNPDYPPRPDDHSKET